MPTATIQPRPPIDPAHAARLADPRLLEAIDACLKAKRVQLQDLDDLRQETLERLVSTAERPADGAGWLNLARTIAEQLAIDLFRKTDRRKKHDVGLTDAADESTGGVEEAPTVFVVEAGEKLALWDDLCDRQHFSKRDQEILRLHAAGHDVHEIAKKVRLSPRTVRRRLTATQQRFAAAWQKFAGVGALLLLLAFFWLVTWGRHRTEARPHEQDLVPEKTAPEGPRPPTALEQAEALRRDAADDCKRADYAPCTEKLDEAARLDPAGERGPDVQAERQQIQHGTEPLPVHAKPGW